MIERGGMYRRTFMKLVLGGAGAAALDAALPKPASGAPVVETPKGSELVAAPESKEYVDYRKTLKRLSAHASKVLLIDSPNFDEEVRQDPLRMFNQVAEKIVDEWAEELAGKDADENEIEVYRRRYSESGVVNLWGEMCKGFSDSGDLDFNAIKKCFVENVGMSFIAMEAARDNSEKWQFKRSSELEAELDTPGSVDFRKVVKKERQAKNHDPAVDTDKQVETYLDIGDARDLETQGQVFVAPRTILAEVALGERPLSSDQRKILIETLTALDDYADGVGRSQKLLLENGILKVEKDDSVKDLGEYVIKQMQRSEPDNVKKLENGFYEQVDKKKSSPLVEAVYIQIKDLDVADINGIARQVSEKIDDFLNDKNENFSLNDQDKQRVANGLQVYLESISHPFVEDNLISLEGTEKLVAMARGFVDVALDMKKLQEFSPVGPWPMKDDDGDYEKVDWDKVDWSRIVHDDQQQTFYLEWPDPDFDNRFMKSLMPLRAFMANAMANPEKFKKIYEKLDYQSKRTIIDSLEFVQSETSKLPDLFAMNDNGELNDNFDGVMGDVHVNGKSGEKVASETYYELIKAEQEWAALNQEYLNK